MKSEDISLWGAKIERGKILAVHQIAEEVFRYDVESIDRPGVKAYRMPDVSGEGYSAGQKVYFASFEDGKGLVFCGIV